MTDPIVKTIDVPCDAATAFDVFVTKIGTWWPLDGHAASAAHGKAALDVTIEPRVGGAVYETMFDGNRDAWGEVLEYEPGVTFAMTWHPGNNKSAPTRVSVRFEALSGSATRVTLTHAGWDAWGEEADAMRGNYNAGWAFVFGVRYAEAAQATENAK